MHSSMAEGLECLKVMMRDRQELGCSITPNDEPAFGIEYQVQHPTGTLELVYLTSDLDLDEGK